MTFHDALVPTIEDNVNQAVQHGRQNSTLLSMHESNMNSECIQQLLALDLGFLQA